jgi:gas vesicle protein
MKNFLNLFAISFLLFSFTSANAFDLDKQLNKIVDTKKSGVADVAGLDQMKKEIIKTLQDNLDKNIAPIKEEVNKYKSKIDAEQKKIENIINEAQADINKIRDIRNNIDHYFNIAKTIIAFLSCSIVVLLFFLWRIWRNVVNFRKIIQNVTNYDDIEKRLKLAEKRIAELSRK